MCVSKELKLFGKLYNDYKLVYKYHFIHLKYSHL